MNVIEECTIKGLECCTNLSKSCVECPYKMIRYPKCREELMRNSRDFVRDLKDAVDQFEMVAPSPGAVEDMARENTELLQKIEQLEQERDAAVRDITLYPCFSCSNNQSKTLCNDCLRNRSNALDAAGKFLPDNYKWRGVCEENGGTP